MLLPRDSSLEGRALRGLAVLAIAALALLAGVRAGSGIGASPAGVTCYTLTTNVGAGSGTIDTIPTSAGGCPTDQYRAGWIVTVSTAPAPGFVWDGWSGTDNDAAPTTTVTMNADRKVTAYFRSNCYTLTTNVGGGTGTITAIPTSSGGCPSNQYSAGYIVTVSTTPGPGFVWSGWSGTDNDAAPTTAVTMNTDRKVTAFFQSNCSTLATNVAAGNGTITVSPSSSGGCPTNQYSAGYIVTVSTRPVSGWVWSGWSGTDNDALPTTTVTMNGDRKVTASFEYNCYSLTTGVGAGSGTVTATPSHSDECPANQYRAGYVVILSATAAPGFEWAFWSGTDGDHAHTTSVTMAGDQNVLVYFAPQGGTDPPTPTPTPSPTEQAPAPTQTPILPPATATPTPPSGEPTPTGTGLPPTTPTGAPLTGDANCSGGVDSVDAALVLQYAAGLLDSLDCRENADADQDGAVDAVDAALILQFAAGLLANLAP